MDRAIWIDPLMLGFRRMEVMSKHRKITRIKRQVAEEFIAGDTVHALSMQHDISRQLIRIWVGKSEVGALYDGVQATDLMQKYEAKIAALERLAGGRALEIVLLRARARAGARPGRRGNTTRQEDTTSGTDIAVGRCAWPDRNRVGQRAGGSCRQRREPGGTAARAGGVARVIQSPAA